MLNSFKLNLIWKIIEQTLTFITPELSDSEIVHLIIEKITERLYLSTSELYDTYFYLESRVSLFRDLAEIQLSKKEVLSQFS